MISQLYFINVPHNCSDFELVEWISSFAIEADSSHIVRDLEAGGSPSFAYVRLKEDSQVERAVSVLNGRKLRGNTVMVKRVPVPHFAVTNEITIAAAS